MLGFFDQLKFRDKFIEINFDSYPFHFFLERGKNINSFIESFLLDLKNWPKNNKLKGERRTIIFTYENKEYEIFKNSINIKLFHENEIIFKAYNNKSQLDVFLIRFSHYYYFYINNKIENYFKNILSKENIKEIILYQFFTRLFF